tara:strand:- start:7959 stop:8201 length:243 start_codon:yes stop_codon:yes gene_type:complete
MSKLRKFNEFINENVDVEINEHDVIRLTMDVGEFEKGTHGTVVHKYEEKGSNHLLFFEIEFGIDGKAKLQYVNSEQIEKV